MKKLLLFIALLISGLGLNAQSVGSSTIVYYNNYSLKFTVTSLEPAECSVTCNTKPDTPTAVAIPSSTTIEGSTFSVTSIGNSAFYDCDGLTSIEIPNSVTSIGNSAFCDCDGLTSIEIPNSVTSIGSYAFSSCNGLTSIEISNSVTSIGASAFSSCSHLGSIVVSNENIVYDSRNSCNAIIETSTNTLLYGCKNTIIPNGVTSIGTKAFYSCSGLTSLEIPNSVISIGTQAFYDCELTSLEIPNSVISIGTQAFYSCELTSLEIPNSVTSIGNKAFASCINLESIVVVGGNPNYDSRNSCNAIIETATNTLLYGCKNTIIPNTVTSIGNEAFYYCPRLTSLEIPNSVTSIGDEAFYGCYGLTSLEIPNSVTSIGTQSFYYCNGLTSLEIPNSVTSIGYEAFRSCYDLESIVVEEGNIVYDSRNNCNAIIETSTNTLHTGCKKTIVPNSVTSIGNNAFSGQYNLTSIELPNSITSIGDKAFISCSKLASLKCHAANVPETAATAFDNCPSDMAIQVPEESLSAYQAAEPWNNYNVTKIHTYQIGDYLVEDYEGYSLRYTVTKLEPAECKVTCETKPTVETAITIPSSVEINNVLFSVTSIGRDAFDYCSKMTSIEIPNSITYIDGSSFNDCNGLTSIEIPNSVTFIGSYAFAWCNGLTSIEIPNSVTTIEEDAFSSCKGLESIAVESGNTVYDSRNNCNAIIETSTNTLHTGCKNTIIPNDISSIGYSAFIGCDGLTSINIPNSVTSIKHEAFRNCMNLTNINIPANVVSIKMMAFENCQKLTSIVIPKSVTSIDNSAFRTCSNLKSIVVEEGNAIYDSRENCNAIIETSTNTLYIGCQSTVIPNSVVAIGEYAFYGHSNLTSIEIPDGVTSIENAAFYNCRNLTSIEIPNSVTSIGESAFMSCSNLTNIKCHAENVPETNSNAFSYCPSDMTIQVPAASLAAYQAAEPWNNYNIVAGFNSTITVSSNIAEAGSVSGGGNHQDGTEITVTAIPNQNYTFLNWTENGVVVSESSKYKFTVSEDRDLVANFSLNHWLPDVTLYANNMSITAIVQIEGIEQQTTDIEIGAFCGNELRGSNCLKYENFLDRYILYLTVYGESADKITFKMYDHATETESELTCGETLTFVVNGSEGSASDPYTLNFKSEVEHERALTSGWNWYSTYIDINGTEGLNKLQEGLSSFGLIIKNQSAFVSYESDYQQWAGALTKASSKEMFMIKMSQAHDLVIEGMMMDPAECEIEILPNWNWIGYAVSENMPVNEAMKNFDSKHGDYLKSQEGFSQYYEGNGWVGALNVMMPGKGYMYRNTSGETKTLVYSTSASKENAKPNVTAENNYWKTSVNKYPSNMNIIAIVENDGTMMSNYELGAFCNGECRGSARPIYIEALDSYMIFLTVYGDAEEEITFRYYDIYADEEMVLDRNINFETDGTVGTLDEPYTINLAAMNLNEVSQNEINIYPNPTESIIFVTATETIKEISVYNMVGVMVYHENAVVRNSIDLSGLESGVYMVKIKTENKETIKQIIKQ